MASLQLFPHPPRTGWCGRVLDHRANACMASWHRMVESTRKSRKLVIAVCHAGLEQFAMPVMQNKRMVGVILGVQPVYAKDGGSFGQAWRHVRDMGPRKGEWKHAYHVAGSIPRSRFIEMLRICRDVAESTLELGADRRGSLEETKGRASEPDAFPAASMAPDVRDDRAGDWARGPMVERAKSYIRANYTEQLRNVQIARSLGCSPLTLTRRFKRATGEGIPAYINQLRVKLAMSLLESTATPAEDVARQAGFGTYRHFNRIFNQYAGTNPLAFRSEKWGKEFGRDTRR